MSGPPFHHLPDVAALVEVPEAGILSRTVHDGPDVRLVLFGLAAGEQLTEHAASLPAVVQVLRGEIAFTVAGEELDLGPGSWLRMDAGARHALRARTPAVMLLTLLRGEAG